MEPGTRQKQEYDSHEQQNSPGRCKFAEDGPHQLLGALKKRRLFLPSGGCSRLVVAPVELKTGLRIAFELHPEIADLQAFGHAIPKLVELGEDARASVMCRSRGLWLRRGWLRPCRTSRTGWRRRHRCCWENYK